MLTTLWLLVEVVVLEQDLLQTVMEEAVAAPEAIELLQALLAETVLQKVH
jgi:hypothetical protein